MGASFIKIIYNLIIVIFSVKKFVWFTLAMARDEDVLSEVYETVMPRIIF